MISIVFHLLISAIYFKIPDKKKKQKLHQIFEFYKRNRIFV